MALYVVLLRGNDDPGDLFFEVGKTALVDYWRDDERHDKDEITYVAHTEVTVAEGDQLALDALESLVKYSNEYGCSIENAMAGIAEAAKLLLLSQKGR